LQTTGDFFGQVTKVFVWSAVGIALAASKLSANAKSS
jgi:hypothetical protein